MTSTPSDLPATMLSTSKRALRSALKKTIKTIPPTSIASQSQTVYQTLLTLPEYTTSQSLSIFLSMPSTEIQTTPLVRHALESGKRVYVPYIRPPPRIADDAPPAAPAPGVMDMLSLSSIADLESLSRDSWGIPTIPEESVDNRRNVIDEMIRARECGREVEGLDLVVMPGLGFDTRRNRIGYGKGFYDFWLERYRVRGLGRVEGEGEERRRGMPRLVAVALGEQVLEEGAIPVGEKDWKVDVLVVGDGRVIR
ncbi:nagb/rpia/CoA transferase-like protein, partial [Ascodesmis nigricans]